METEDFNIDSQDINLFYYTNDKHIRKMDDKFILSKVQEKYPDLTQNSDDNILKSVISIIMSDSDLMQQIESEYNLNTFDVIKIIYRNYEYVFNTCFITRIQKIMKNRKYAKQSRNSRKN